MPLTFVIFGASGDLTSRKLVPALYQLFRKRRLPAGTQIVGFSRRPFSDDQWRKSLGDSTQQMHADAFDRSSWDQFAKALHYHAGDMNHAPDFDSLHKHLTELEGGASGVTRVYYLATAPQFYEETVARLVQADWPTKCMGRGGS